MAGKPCAFGTLGTETWALLMNSRVYLAKRRNPSVILGCWLPVETWHCSQALKWIKKNARGKTGMQGQKGETGNIERSGLLCLQREAKRKKPLSLEPEVHWPAVCSVGGWYPNVPGGGDFGTFCLSCDDCWEAATLAFREVQRRFAGSVGSLYNFKNARLRKAASPVKLPPDFAVCWLLTAQGWRSALSVSLALLWLLKTHENHKSSRW